MRLMLPFDGRRRGQAGRTLDASAASGDTARAMSQENQKRLLAMQRGTEAFNRRDVEGMIEELDPEIEWKDGFQVLLGGEATTFHGHDGVRDLIREQDAG
jgi:hypothetical protein